MKQVPPFHLCTTLWGTYFCDKFLHITLPTLMAPGNLPDWPWLKASRFVFYTTRPDRDYLSGQAAIKQLNAYLPLEWRFLEDVATPWKQLPPNPVWRKYAWMSTGDAHAIDKARHEHAAMVRIFPDGIYSYGSLIHLATLIQHGKELVFLYVPRLCESVWMPRLRQEVKAGVLALQPTECVDMMISPMHPETASYFWYSSTYAGQNPRLLWYWVNHHVFESHCADVDIVYMKEPRPFNAIVPGTNHTMDMDYIHQYTDWLDTPQEDKIALIQNNEMLFIALSAEEPYMVAYEQTVPFHLRPGQVWRFLKQHRANPLRQWLFRRVIRWTATATIEHPYPVGLYQQMAPQAPWKIPALFLEMEYYLKNHNHEALEQLLSDADVRNMLMGLNDDSLSAMQHTFAEAFTLVRNQC